MRLAVRLTPRSAALRRRTPLPGEPGSWPRARAPAETPRRWSVSARGNAAAPTPPRARHSLRALSFALVVLLPVTVAATYYFAFAADQYVAEFRFTLSTADPPPLDPLSLLSGTAARTPAALESQILVEYISSRSIVDDIDPAINLRRLFATPQADWWSRLSQGAPIEELVRYWQGQVDPFYDPATGTVTVRVRAFSPGDALRVARAISVACEHLVNELSLRARRDALRGAEDALTKAHARLADALDEIRRFRDRTGIVDPAAAATGQDRIAARLQEELIAANARLTTLATYMRADAPTLRVLRAQIASLEQQRRLVARRMTGNAKADAGTLSAALNAYEALDSKRKFAEAAYQLALRGVDEARANADRQHVFVASFVPPALPQEAGYPRRWRSLGVVALLAFAVWAIGGLAAQSMRDHLG